MSETLYGFTAAQVRQIVEVVRRVNAMPRGQRAGLGTYHSAGPNVAEFKLQAALSDASTSGVDAKFWFGGTEGDTVKMYPFGVNGTVASGSVIVAYFWDGKWKFLASISCPS